MSHNFCLKIFNQINNFFLPETCFYCKKLLNGREVFCEKCRNLIKPIVPLDLKIGKYKISIFAISKYEDPLKSLILAKNYGNIVAAHYQGILMTQFLPLRSLKCDYIVPVPLHWTRYAYRGFNQSEVAAKVVGDFLKKPVLNILNRKKKTQFQAELNAIERKENVKDIFKIKFNEKFHGKHILILDDLVTTNSTISSVCNVLFALYPASINVIVTCKTL